MLCRCKRVDTEHRKRGTMLNKFDPEVVEVPPKKKPDYADKKFMNPDQDAFVTYGQAVKICEACFDPGLHITQASIPKAVREYKIEDQPGEFRYTAQWSNGFKNDVPTMGVLFDTKGLRGGLRQIYDEMKAGKLNVPWWVYDKVK